MTMLVPEWQWGYDGWIVAITALVAMTCAIPGSFLLVRRQSMLGDAVSHAVLPGIAIGFLVSGTRDGGWMLAGAIVAGLVTAMLTQLLRSVGGVDRGAALGVVFTTLFALGLVLIVQVADSVDLDPSCVLYGQVELAPLDVVDVGGFPVPRAVPWLLGVLVVTVFIVQVIWKELLVASFDPATAAAQGGRPNLMQQILMVLVAAGCVVAFEAVGSILVVSLLVAPAAAARLVTNRLRPMMLVAMLIGVLAAVGGHLSALLVPRGLGLETKDVSTSGATAVFATFLVVVAVLVSPQQGLLVATFRRLALRFRIAEEDLLGVLYRREVESRGLGSTAGAQLSELGAGGPGLAFHGIMRFAAIRLRWAGHVTPFGPIPHPDQIKLTDAGRVRASVLIRRHRLWELYLAGAAAIPLDHLHATAMDLEHLANPDLLESLEAEAAKSARDPQGRDIPRRS
ncbi:MAG: metal ABC transporter permease [Phycisphaerales bacterium]